MTNDRKLLFKVDEATGQQRLEIEESDLPMLSKAFKHASRSPKLLKLAEVTERVGLGKSAIYERIAAGTFPSPVQVGTSARWVEAEVVDWLDKVAQERKAP